MTSKNSKRKSVASVGYRATICGVWTRSDKKMVIWDTLLFNTNQKTKFVVFQQVWMQKIHFFHCMVHASFKTNLNNWSIFRHFDEIFAHFKRSLNCLTPTEIYNSLYFNKGKVYFSEHIWDEKSNDPCSPCRHPPSRVCSPGVGCLVCKPQVA